MLSTCCLLNLVFLSRTPQYDWEMDSKTDSMKSGFGSGMLAFSRLAHFPSLARISLACEGVEGEGVAFLAVKLPRESRRVLSKEQGAEHLILERSVQGPEYL